MTGTEIMNTSLKFYGKNIFCGFIEEWSNIFNLLAQCISYPLFVWIFAKLWVNLTGYNGTFSFDELVIYIGLTQIIFLTTLRGPMVDISDYEFLMTLTKPRYWPGYIGSLIFSKRLGRRFILLLIFLIFIPMIISNYRLSFISAFRFITFLPLLCIFEMFYTFLIVCAQINYLELKYFRMTLTKVIMICGGVITPLCDIGHSLSSIFIKLPIADIIFQPCYFCLKGNFYKITSEEWLTHIIVQFIFLVILSQIVYMITIKNHQCYGG